MAYKTCILRISVEKAAAFATAFSYLLLFLGYFLYLFDLEILDFAGYDGIASNPAERYIVS